jgi:hypothetical protein
MTNNTKKMLFNEAVQTAEKASAAAASVNTAIQAGEGRVAYYALIESMAAAAKLQAIQAAINDGGADNAIMTLASIFTISALKTAARGHAVKGKDGKNVKGYADNNGKFIKDESGDTIQMTPANLVALRVLQYGIHDDSGIMDDLKQETAIKVWEAIADGRATIGEKTDDNGVTVPTFDLTDPENDRSTMRDIFNVTQAYLYSNLQRHYKHEYRPIIDDNGNEDTIMITAAMRAYEKSIEYIGKDELFRSLTAVLDERETAILMAKCDKKQVERAYSDNGVSKKRYVSRYKTIAEISAETGYTVKEVRNSLKKIADKLRAICEDNGRVARVRSNKQINRDSLAWTNTDNETVYDTDNAAETIADKCAACSVKCNKWDGGGDNLQLCVYAELWLV